MSWRNKKIFFFNKVFFSQNINFNIPAKTSVGIVGATGSGKTTLVDIILGLLEAQQGLLEVDGKEINNYNILVQVTLNINNLFFEKTNCSINNNSVREQHAFNKSKQELVTELKIKKQKEKTTTEKKKLIELKKAAELKMKLKIKAVEQIDKIILSKK